jgi:pyrroline-5-carboxylate reductase
MSGGPRIGFIGGGTMGSGIIHGLLERGRLAPGRIIVCESLAVRRAELSDRFGVTVVSDYGPALETDAVVLAIKPQEFAAAADAIRAHLRDTPLLISIMAGVRLASILAGLPVSRAVRVMPNLGAVVGESFSTWYATPSVTNPDRELVRMVLGAIGREYEAPAEAYLDMATAVAGSGPGYVTLLVEALIDGAVYIGLPRALATEMVMQTVRGTLRWAEENGGHPAELRAQVVSPAGTTAEGVLALERGGVRAALMEAIIAGYDKSKALGA